MRTISLKGGGRSTAPVYPRRRVTLPGQRVPQTLLLPEKREFGGKQMLGENQLPYGLCAGLARAHEGGMMLRGGLAESVHRFRGLLNHGGAFGKRGLEGGKISKPGGEKFPVRLLELLKSAKGTFRAPKVRGTPR